MGLKPDFKSTALSAQAAAHEVGQILVLCPIGLGNFLLCLPALRSLSQTVGPQRLSVLALKPAIATMARGSGLCGEVLAWDPDREGILRGLALLRTLRARRCSRSVALFPTGHWKFAALQFLSGARRRLGFAYPHQRASAWVQHHSLPVQDQHDVAQNLRLIEFFLGRKLAEAGSPFFPLPPEYPAGLNREEKFFACHPGSSAERGMAEKRLPALVFAELIRRIHYETGWSCVLVGGSEEQSLRAAVAAECPEAILPVSAASLPETAGLLQRARLFLGNDSGLMHLAAAVGTRCAAFFGPTDERRTGPFGYWEDLAGQPRHLILRRGELTCAPCWTVRTLGNNPPCIYGDTRCLRDFGAEGIWKRLRDWIGSL